jgi:hypothetical protein
MGYEEGIETLGHGNVRLGMRRRRSDSQGHWLVLPKRTPGKREFERAKVLRSAGAAGKWLNWFGRNGAD